MKKSLLILLTFLLIMNIGINAYAVKDEILDTEEVEDEADTEDVLEEDTVEEDVTSIPVLLYHHIIPEKDLVPYNWLNNESVISEENFKEQMDYLYENGYYTATLDELESFIKGELTLPKDTVVITFDDGYLSNAKFAHPIMKDYGFRGAIFMVGNTAIRAQKVFSPLGTQHINVNNLIRYSDVFEYGSHTFNMHYLNNGKPAVKILSEQEIYSDLMLNKYFIKTDFIAYPYGEYNEKVLNSVGKLGYRLGFSTKPRYVTVGEPIYEVPRFSIYQNTSMDEFEAIVIGKK